MLIDKYLPSYDVTERHQVTIRAPIEKVYESVRALDMNGSAVIRALFFLREIPGYFTSRSRPDARLGLTFDGLLQSGFILLGESSPEEILLGLVGRFWTASGCIQRLDAAGFQSFDEPGYAKAAWNFSLKSEDDGRTRLATETRVLCLDAASRRRFRIYWTFIRPFSGLTRKEVLRAVRKQVER